MLTSASGTTEAARGQWHLDAGGGQGRQLPSGLAAAPASALARRGRSPFHPYAARGCASSARRMMRAIVAAAGRGWGHRWRHGRREGAERRIDRGSESCPAPPPLRVVERIHTPSSQIFEKSGPRQPPPHCYETVSLFRPARFGWWRCIGQKVAISRNKSKTWGNPGKKGGEGLPRYFRDSSVI